MVIRGEDEPAVIDARQLVRIEAVHRGFLYQHLYAVECLLRAGGSGAVRIVVERDEDIEIVHPNHRVYVQVKTRAGVLAPTDVEDALARFAALRHAHRAGARPGDAHFVIACNAPPSPKLANMVGMPEWPSDVRLDWPDGPEPRPGLPRPARDIRGALAGCDGLAASLPFAMLRPETLTWKLAGTVTLAASGTSPREDHSFQRAELADLFEQIIVQMQDLPAPPPGYRPQIDEPPLAMDRRVRIVVGLSGAGKTAWLAQAALHCPRPVVYLDTTDIPGGTLASAIAREAAAKLVGTAKGGSRDLLLPGASPLDMLGALSVKLGLEGESVLVVLDNAHGLPVPDVRAVVDRAPNLRFLLLCQPGPTVVEMETILDTVPETLGGWDEDTVAAVAADAGCRAGYPDCERLSRITGALPFYVVNAVNVARREYGGSLAGLCSDLEARTHLVSVAQEIILQRAFGSLSVEQRQVVALLSLADVVLTRDEAVDLLRGACGIDMRTAAERLRSLPRTGLLESFGNHGLKVHDAARIIGRADASGRGARQEQAALAVLRDVIIGSMKRRWSVARVALLVRLFGQLRQADVLAEFATDELFHEMGVWQDIEPFLASIAMDADEEPRARFWTLDGLVFNDLRVGEIDHARTRLACMRALLDAGGLGSPEWLAWSMKHMLALTERGNVEGVLALGGEIEARLPATAGHHRIFRYNRALALFKLGAFQKAAAALGPLIHEYYGLLRITPADVVGRNASDLRPLLPRSRDLVDDLKHLADSLDLHAQSLGGLGVPSPFGRIHAMKFYELASAPQSFVRVGMDLVDEHVQRSDFQGARDLLEQVVFPTVQRMGLVDWTFEVRSQYAVVLAYCGEHDEADAEMVRLSPYRSGLDPRQGQQFLHQLAIVDDLRRSGAPRQATVAIPPALQAEFDRRSAGRSIDGRKRKIGRNEACPCRSGRKFKHCHGR